MYFDNNEMVRFKVITEEWHDQTPSKPVEAAAEAGAAAAAAGEEGSAPPAISRPPYQIVGSMSGPGLGCCLWWE
jgi:DNA-directed RNA polymerase III subunit RPC8